MSPRKVVTPQRNRGSGLRFVLAVASGLMLGAAAQNFTELGVGAVPATLAALVHVVSGGTEVPARFDDPSANSVHLLGDQVPAGKSGINIGFGPSIHGKAFNHSETAWIQAEDVSSSGTATFQPLHLQPIGGQVSIGKASPYYSTTPPDYPVALRVSASTNSQSLIGGDFTLTATAHDPQSKLTAARLIAEQATTGAAFIRALEPKAFRMEAAAANRTLAVLAAVHSAVPAIAADGDGSVGIYISSNADSGGVNWVPAATAAETALSIAGNDGWAKPLNYRYEQAGLGVDAFWVNEWGHVYAINYALISSRDIKNSIETLSAHEAWSIVNALQTVSYRYKGHSQHQLGFLADDAPHSVAIGTHTGVSAASIVAAVTRATQSLVQQSADFEQKVAALSDAIAETAAQGRAAQKKEFQK